MLEFTLAMAQLEPEEFAAEHLGPDDVVVAGEDFRFGRKRRGDLELLRSLGHEVRVVPRLAGVLVVRDQASAPRGRRARRRQPPGASAGARRRRRARRPARRHARLSRPPTSRSTRACSCRATASTRAPRAVRTAAVPRGDVDRHEPALRRPGAADRAVPARLRGRPVRQRLVVELWERLRDERAFASEQELVDQIARDVERTRAVSRPSETATSGSAAWPLRRGSPAAPLRPMTLTPPK